MSIGTTSRRRSSSSSNSNGSGRTNSKRPGKRPGRKPSKVDEHAKLERSRQSARECRARKKLRYQYLEELVVNREKAVFALRDELETFKQWCLQMDTHGTVPEALVKLLARESTDLQQRQMKDSHGALQQQQQITQRPSSSLSSSSSSRSSNNGSPHLHSPHAQDHLQHHQQRHHHQLQQQQQQQTSGSQSQLQRPAGFSQDFNLPKLSPALSAAGSPVSVSRSPVTSQPPLRRQMAVDVPTTNPQQILPIHHLRSHQSQTTSSQQQQQQQQQQIVESPHGQVSPKAMGQQPVSPAQMRQAMLQQRSPVHPIPGPSHLQHIQQFPLSDASISQPSHHSSISINKSQIPSSTFAPGVSRGHSSSTQQTLPRVKSEPPLQYSQSVDNPQSASYSQSGSCIPPYSAPRSVGSLGQCNDSTVSSRVRSASNPSSMMTGPIKTQGASGDPSFGGFAPLPFENQSPMLPIPFGNISATIPVEAAIPTTTAQNSVPDNFLFESHQASSSSHGKAMSRPSLSKQFRQSRGGPYPGASGVGLAGRGVHHSQQQSSFLPRTVAGVNPVSSSMYDPHATLNNLTTVHCFSATRTSNTPSPAPYGLIPMGGGGFRPVSSSTKPSSSTTSSPAPPPPVSSFQELSLPDKHVGLSQSVHQSQPASYPATAAIGQSQSGAYQVPFSSQQSVSEQSCSSSGLGSLSASIEPIEEFYSYLKDLQDGKLPPELPEGQMVPSSNVKPGDALSAMADPSMLNLPTIIDDLLSRDGTESNAK